LATDFTDFTDTEIDFLATGKVVWSFICEIRAIRGFIMGNILDLPKDGGCISVERCHNGPIQRRLSSVHDKNVSANASI
jgi:hypothetical protein